MPGSKPGALGHLATPHRLTNSDPAPRHASRASSSGDRDAPATTRLRPRSRQCRLRVLRPAASRARSGRSIRCRCRSGRPGRGATSSVSTASTAGCRRREHRLEGIAERRSRKRSRLLSPGLHPASIQGLGTVRGSAPGRRVDQQVPGRRQLDRRAAARRRPRPRHCGRARTPARRRRAPGPSSASRVVAQPGAPEPVERHAAPWRHRRSRRRNRRRRESRFCDPQVGAKRRCRVAACSGRAARTSRSSSSGDAGGIAAVAPDQAVVAHPHRESGRPSPAAGTRSAARGSRRRGGR